MKTPDAVSDAVNDAIRQEFENREDLSPDERLDLEFEMEQQLTPILKKWIQWGEIVMIQVDTDAETAIVLPASSY